MRTTSRMIARSIKSVGNKMKLMRNLSWLCILSIIFTAPIFLTGKAVDNQDDLEVYCNLSGKLKSLENKELAIEKCTQFVRDSAEILEIILNRDM